VGSDAGKAAEAAEEQNVQIGEAKLARTEVLAHSVLDFAYINLEKYGLPIRPMRLAETRSTGSMEGGMVV
jgi:hypothetical protein